MFISSKYGKDKMNRPDFTKIAVQKQVEAMACNAFEVGMFNPQYQDKQTGEVGDVSCETLHALLQGLILPVSWSYINKCSPALSPPKIT